MERAGAGHRAVIKKFARITTDTRKENNFKIGTSTYNIESDPKLTFWDEERGNLKTQNRNEQKTFLKMTL